MLLICMVRSLGKSEIIVLQFVNHILVYIYFDIYTKKKLCYKPRGFACIEGVRPGPKSHELHLLTWLFSM